MTTNDATRTALRAEQGMWEAFAEEERIKQEMAAMGKANNDAERVALVIDLTREIQAIAGTTPYDLLERNMQQIYERETERRILPIIDKLLADRAAPEPDAGDDLDAMLNSVHPKCRIEMVSPYGPGWKVRIKWPRRIDKGVVTSESYALAYGETRREAVAKAVDAARRGQSDADSR